MHNVVIIGGMAAGCKAAARLSRLSPDQRVTIVERSPFISFSSCGLPLFASGEVDGISDLTKTSYGVIRDEEYFRKVKGVKVLTKTEVEEVWPEKNEVRCRKIDTEDSFVLPYDSLIIATGAEAVKPKFPYVRSPVISSFHYPWDAENFRKAAQKGKISKAVIIGGGFVGCELIEAMGSLWGIETVLVEKEESLLSACLDPEISLYLQSCIGSDKIQLLLSTTVDRLGIDDTGFPVVSLENGRQIVSDQVFYCLGVKPNSELARKSGIRLGKHGGILVDRQMRTSIRNIWAAGDCVEVRNLVTDTTDFFSFGSLSNRMGRAAADSIAGRHASFKGAVGTVSLKLFDNIICAAGLTEAKALTFGYETGSVIGCWSDRPDYHPEAKLLLGKLVYEKPGLRLLGLQLVGEGEVTRYIDVFSELLAQRKTIEDLVDLEHGYTPAHSSPISPLNYLGFMACDQESDGVRNASPLLVSSFDGIFIDVRESSEPDSLPFPEKSIHIPLADLRTKLNDFDSERSIMFICERGPRGYEAARLFMEYGHNNVSYLGGGNLLYKAIKESHGICRDRRSSESAVFLNEDEGTMPAL
ncbi:MAG: FAD-dependent oxidoreductase [Bacteroidetes bacterium]|nr:FAD-dependent oxidoreductase [Bacteroidota bacterium]